MDDQGHSLSDSATEAATDYRRKADGIAALIGGVSTADWAADSPCEGWAAADVMAHLIETQRDFLAGHDLSVPAPADSLDPVQQWKHHTSGVAALLADPVVAGRDIDGFFGPTTIGATVGQFYGWDMLVHRWDLAQAMGREAGLSDNEVDEIEAAVPLFGEALHMPGICAAAVEVEESQPRLVQVLAQLGRDARAQHMT